ncbi:hypothetical protein LOC54_07110 [Acetobacter sp. AN02]|uniref:hypothetical protein n=1 Tax=Acetobacter sp. AN02 TaxID=2894186 RepID=UPI0024341836|nr:hypothetical protein [Acetobacter sp. AN02]MDG6094880.1 hypothetical protein [Acetobacter sp. AN02]
MSSRSRRLHVVTTRSNPLQWSVPDRIYHEWAQHMLASGVHLTVVECQYGDRPFTCRIPGVHHVGGRADSLTWVKERCLNIGISRLPDDWNYVAWIDSDIFFRRPDWARETVEALQQFDVIQPWTDCYDLGPDGGHMLVHRSFCRMWMDGEPILQGPGAHRSPYRFAHPGYAWAARRSALSSLGGGWLIRRFSALRIIIWRWLWPGGCGRAGLQGFPRGTGDPFCSGRSGPDAMSRGISGRLPGRSSIISTDRSATGPMRGAGTS